ncbi:MAG: exodeoxyribonuclease I, partial [Burkholderiales bacterium]|nr:exodeoxyribonuclease I [Burkholderiales bacterium]
MTGNSKDIQRTFYWFDFETFGLDPSRDRPAQFGGLRTSMQMEPIGKPDLLYCLPAEDYLPDPEACMVTRITPFKCFDEGEPEAVFASKIFSRLSKPGTIAIGYNNIAFDDEVTRFMFWRNLIDPYSREWGQGRRRLDLFKIVLALYAFRPKAILWPKNADGSLSFRLEHLSKINQLDHSHAHDALSDTFATFYLGRLIKAKEPKFWEFAIKNTEKKVVVAALEPPSCPKLYVDSHAGAAAHFLRVIYPLRANPSRTNEWYCWDLKHHPDELYSLTEEEVRKRAYPSSEDRKNGVQALPFVKVRTQATPFIIDVPKNSFDSDFAETLGISLDEVHKRALIIVNRGLDIMNMVFPVLDDERKKRFNEPADQRFLETRLYSEKFLSDEDKTRLDHLRRV